MKLNEKLLLSLLVEVDYRLVNSSMWLIFLFKFPLLGKSTTSFHKEMLPQNTKSKTQTPFQPNFFLCLNLNQKLLPSLKVEVAEKGVIRPRNQYYRQILSYGQIYALVQVTQFHQTQSQGHTCTYICLFLWCQMKKDYHHLKPK